MEFGSMLGPLGGLARANQIILEPHDMASVELKLLTLKTDFLLSLATGMRRGEIQALDRSRIRRSADGQDVFLETLCGICV